MSEKCVAALWDGYCRHGYGDKIMVLGLRTTIFHMQFQMFKGTVSANKWEYENTRLGVWNGVVGSMDACISYVADMERELDGKSGMTSG